MQLFDFLKILSAEKFPFKLNYIEWSNTIEITVNTFAEIEVYNFNDDGIFNHITLNKQAKTEDKAAIIKKINKLVKRPENAWVDAAKDLAIRFIHPYKFTGIDNQPYEVTGLLPDFGNGKGVLITSRKDSDEACIMAGASNEYATTGLNPTHYDKYNRTKFIETLSEWGWIGIGEKPDWMNV